MNQGYDHLKGKRMCIEGNIAAGKTTLADQLFKLYSQIEGLKIERISEKIDHELLEKFNDDPRIYAEEFQKSMMKNRLDGIKKARELAEHGYFVLMDTGIIREFAFADANEQVGNMSKEDYVEHILEFRRELSKINMPYPEYIVLLVSDGKTSMKNISQRNRSNETLLDEKYLDVLHNCHVNRFAAISKHMAVENTLMINVADNYAGPEDVKNYFLPIPDACPFCDDLV